MVGDGRPSIPASLGLRESLLTLILLAAVIALPAWSVKLAGWTDHLEPVLVFGVLGVAYGWALGRMPWPPLASHALGIGGGAALATLWYSWFLPGESFVERVPVFVARVSQWLAAAFTGSASTDNLLFAYSMALLVWLFGYAGAWAAFRPLTAWVAIVPAGAGLLLNLSYASPDLLPLVFIYLVASFLLLMNVNAVGRITRWRFEDIDHALHQGAGYALTGAAVGVGIVFLAWRMPVGDVSRNLAQGWERVAGPWQDAQATFDRLFASLNPSPVSNRGLSALSSLAPRGSFELGDKPVFRVSGRQPAYWRATTYDRYTGQLMTSTNTSSERRDRRQPLIQSTDTDDGRHFVEYSFTVLAPGSSIIYAPDMPVTVSLPTVYERRGDVRDFALLRPVVGLREQQQYSVLASVSTASVSELRQAGTIYPGWTKPYLQLPDSFPEPVRQEAWRQVGDATTVYDAAAGVENYLRSLPYKTRVQVPPPGRDWVSFLLFDSREGYCDYYAAAMTVMLRAVGIPARVATGYVTGDWDPAVQSYLVTEGHAHTWTEVYFPGYGWVTFEPSGNRPLPPRPEFPLVASSDEEIQRLLEAESGRQDFLDEEDLDDEGGMGVLPGTASDVGFPWGNFLFLILVGTPVVGAMFVGLIWVRDTARLPAFARPYGQVVRLASWCGFAPRPSQTPYEYTGDLARVMPEAAEALGTISAVYVEGIYGRRLPDVNRLQRLRQASGEAGQRVVRSLGVDRGRRWLVMRLSRLVGERR